MTVKLGNCSIGDLIKLQEVSIETFNDTFKDQNSPENMKTYGESIYIRNKYQGKGLGKHLINKAMEIAVAQKKTSG